MNIHKTRRGSALLIVIGMLSFMVVSAVSFSIYMRQSRVPSSYLRRASSSRYLLKAALAHAIDRLDGTFASYADIGNTTLGSSSESGLVEGVYDDPYPGVGPAQANDTQYHERNGDWWNHRVFTPFGSVGPEKTVSTLTLEGLAYLPPAMINEARVFTRQTRTASWRNLSYDMGRYAFSAIDVSDCFDINRLRAGERRTSAPDQRVNFSSLFESSYGTQLDNVLKLWEQDDIPFVSVADFNIAAGTSSQFAPFCKYIGTSGRAIYSSSDSYSVSNALFITDTWFPATNTTTSAANTYDLASDQPFEQYRDNMSLRDMITGTTRFCKMLTKNIGVGIACLYDYLDEDSLPISFCLPTVETAPMVCGIGLLHNNQFTPTVAQGQTVTGTYTDAKGKPGTWTATPYNLTKFAGTMLLNGAAVFPFKRVGARDGYPTRFSGKALVRVFMGPTGMKCRVPESSPLRPVKSDWDNTSGSVADGMLTIACDLDPISFGDVKTQDEAVKDITARLTLPQLDAPVYWLVEQTDSSDEKTSYISFEWCRGGLAPRDADGKVESWWTAAATKEPPAQSGTASNAPPAPSTAAPATQYVPHVAVWLKLEGDDGTVDIVPATLQDDETWGQRSINLANQADKFGGSGTPILEFRGTRPFTYSVDGETAIATVLNGTAEPFSEWAELYAPDPRYNFAPEDWCPVSGSGAAKGQKWLEKIGAKTGGGILGQNGRDKDIFMFVSDQKYMQSLGELAFLPALGTLGGNENFFDNDYLDAMSANLNGKDFAQRTKFGDGAKLSVGGLASGDFMWRTYSPQEDPIYDLMDGSTPVEVFCGKGDFRVNPFSSDSRVLMAALKDTPFDYYVASTNKTLNPTANDRPSNANDYAFTKNSSDAPMDDDELLDLADAMRDGFAASARAGHSWEAAFNDLDWFDGSKNGDEQNSLFGVELNNPLHGVDRKYLYSFWRECFQNRQQLFLVFIRAEPMTVGGSGSSSLANTQLGARGVALVWRDPAPPKRGARPARTALTTRQAWRTYYQQNAPHRTRVLFYHQFD